MTASIDREDQTTAAPTDANGGFTGKVALVTGAASGMGRATALAFAREGTVVAADIAEQGNDETARMIGGLGGRAIAVRCDVTRGEDVRAAQNEAVETLGRLDLALNNAGLEQPVTATADISDPQEVAAAVLWLCSDAASFVVGHAMVVDGGRTA